MKLKKVLTLFKFKIANYNTTIKDQHIMVNKQVITDPEYEVAYHDIITYKGISLPFLASLNLVLYKPAGYLCANKDTLHPIVYELLPAPYKYYRLSIAGRLDLDTEGVVVFTSSGKINHYITNPLNGIVKSYEVTTQNIITTNQLKALAGELLLLDGNNTPYLAKVLTYQKIAPQKIIININMGRYHQVKRIFKALRNPLIHLKRLSVGKLTLRNLKVGTVYSFTQAEI